MLVPVTDRTMPWTPADDERLLDGRYRLGDRLGSGAVAEVFRALDERLARPVAVKLFRGDAAEELQRHEAEMRTLARLDHPSLVTVYDAGDADGQPYLVMQLVEGDTLADELGAGRSSPSAPRGTARRSPMRSPTCTARDRPSRREAGQRPDRGDGACTRRLRHRPAGRLGAGHAHRRGARHAGVLRAGAGVR